VFEHGLAYARSAEFNKSMEWWQWLRIVGDIVFAVGAVLMTYDFIVKLRPLLPPRAAIRLAATHP
jgi:nitric oxide reductase subunit B